MTHNRCRLVAQIFVLKDQYKAQRQAHRIETVVRRRKGEECHGEVRGFYKPRRLPLITHKVRLLAGGGALLQLRRPGHAWRPKGER